MNLAREYACFALQTIKPWWARLTTDIKQASQTAVSLINLFTVFMSEVKHNEQNDIDTQLKSKNHPSSILFTKISNREMMNVAGRASTFRFRSITLRHV